MRRAFVTPSGSLGLKFQVWPILGGEPKGSVRELSPSPASLLKEAEVLARAAHPKHTRILQPVLALALSQDLAPAHFVLPSPSYRGAFTPWRVSGKGKGKRAQRVLKRGAVASREEKQGLKARPRSRALNSQKDTWKGMFFLLEGERGYTN